MTGFSPVIYPRKGENTVLKNDIVFDIPVFNGTTKEKKIEGLIPKYNQEKTQEHCKEVVSKKILQLDGIDGLNPHKIDLSTFSDEVYEEDTGVHKKNDPKTLKDLLMYTEKIGNNQKYTNSNMQRINLQQRLEQSLILDKTVNVEDEFFTRKFIFKSNE